MTMTLTVDDWLAVRLSCQVATLATLAGLGPAVLVGWLLARRQFAAKPIVDTLVGLPLVMPPVTTGYLLLWLFGQDGPIGSPLKQYVGAQIPFSFLAAVIAAAVVAFPLMVRAARIAFEMLDAEMETAAHTLGASPWRVFRTVSLPLALPGLLAGMALGFARSLGEFGATIVFAGNLAGETRTLPLAIYTQMQVPGGETQAFKLATLSVVIAGAAMIASQAMAKRMHPC